MHASPPLVGVGFFPEFFRAARELFSEVFFAGVELREGSVSAKSAPNRASRSFPAAAAAIFSTDPADALL